MSDAFQLKGEINPDFEALERGLAEIDRKLEAFARKERADISAGKLDSQLGDQLARLDDLLDKVQQEARQTGDAIGETGVRASKAEREALAYAQSLARLQAAEGNAAEAAAILQRALDGTNKETLEAIRVQTQLERVQNQVEQSQRQVAASSNNLGGVVNKLEGAFGALGIAVGAQQLIQFGGEAIQAANRLEQTEATVRALAGSTERYEEVLALAEQGQQKYGGSLEKNIAGLGGLVNLSNRAGVELGQLDNISRRLATVDPLQGIEGASYALKEFLSGDTATAARSLVERFELSPKLKEIAASGGTAQEKIAALDAELNNLGITNEVLANRTETTAATYDRLGAAADNAKVQLGGIFSRGLEDAAKGAIVVINGVTEALERQAEAAEKVRDRNAEVAESATYQEYIANIQRLERESGQMYSGALALTEAQFNQAKSTEAGASAYDAYAAAARDAASRTGEHTEAVARDADEVEKLQKKLVDTGERGSEAADRLAEAQADYATDTARRRDQLVAKLAEIEQSGGERLLQLDAAIAERRADQAQQLADRQADIRADAASRLADLERDVQRDLASAEADYQAQQEEAARAHIERMATLEEKLADAAQDTADKIAQIDADLAEKRTREAESTADRIANIQKRLADQQRNLNEQIADAAQTYQDRLADLQQRAADDRADREQDHTDKLVDLQARLGAATTDELRATIQRQIEQEQREYQQREERARRDEQRAIEKLERERARDEARAQEKLARLQAELDAQLVAEEAAAAKRAARLEADAAQDRERAAAALAEKQADIAQDIAAQEERYAREAGQRQAAYEAERTERAAKFTEQRADLQAKLDEQLADLQAAYDREQAQQTAKYERDRAAQEAALAERLEKERNAFSIQEADRAASFARQEAQLKESLGKQLEAYTETQLQLGQITAEEAARRRAILAAEYGINPNAGASFGALAGSLGAGSAPGGLALAADLVGSAAGLVGLQSPVTGILSQVARSAQINVFGVTDPRQVALMVRDELLALEREGGTG